MCILSRFLSLLCIPNLHATGVKSDNGHQFSELILYFPLCNEKSSVSDLLQKYLIVRLFLFSKSSRFPSLDRECSVLHTDHGANPNVTPQNHLR